MYADNMSSTALPEKRYPSFFDPTPPPKRAITRLEPVPPDFARQCGFDNSMWGQAGRTPLEEAQLRMMGHVRCELLAVAGEDPKRDSVSLEWKPYFKTLQRRICYQWMRGDEAPLDIETAAEYLRHIDGNPRYRPYPERNEADYFYVSPPSDLMTAWEQWELDQFADWLARR